MSVPCLDPLLVGRPDPFLLRPGLHLSSRKRWSSFEKGRPKTRGPPRWSLTPRPVRNVLRYTLTAGPEHVTSSGPLVGHRSHIWSTQVTVSDSQLEPTGSKVSRPNVPSLVISLDLPIPTRGLGVKISTLMTGTLTYMTHGFFFSGDPETGVPHGLSWTGSPGESCDCRGVRVWEICRT